MQLSLPEKTRDGCGLGMQLSNPAGKPRGFSSKLWITEKTAADEAGKGLIASV